MGIREKVREKPALSGGIALLLVAGAVAYAVRAVMPSTAYMQAYFTTDDGQSLFAASMDLQAPFDHHGKPAVRAWVFSCDGGNTRFIAYLERCTAAGMQRMAKERAAYDAGKTHRPPQPN